ncbi:hypothetical protein [Bacillus coahuilensis]|uniref:hypothetical protein n=1 Tax=Bacillus coahuilensis TaxID=408580 RepID=UPI00018512FE|nr:hypothetical protein [Bacillus coahuilensis]
MGYFKKELGFTFNPFVVQVVIEDLIKEGYSEEQVHFAYATYTVNKDAFGSSYFRYSSLEDTLKQDLLSILEGGQC